jgi:hypothetical protein
VTVSQNNLDISTDNIKAHVVDTAGNDISSTNNALNVQVMNEFLGVNVAGLSFQNVGLIMADRDEVILNNGYATIGSSTYLSKLIGYRSMVATTGSDITTNTADAFNYGLLSGGVAVYAMSSSANDTNAAGTGARMLIIRGVDNAGEDGTATLLMNGTTTTGVADVAFSKINYIQVMSAGSSQTNVGKITLYDNATDTEICNIPIGSGISTLGLLSIPNMRTVFLRQCTIQTTSAQTVYFYINDNMTNCWTVKYMCLVNGAITVDLKLRLISASDLRVYSVATTTPGSCNVSIDYYMLF